jgi:hypothetical protein
LLLGEIGEAGVERLLRARFSKNAASDGRAFAVAADYLRRAGCGEVPGGDEVAVPGSQAVLRFAGSPSLAEPAAAVIGAFSAVEHLKAALEMGDTAAFPTDLQLRTEG